MLISFTVEDAGYYLTRLIGKITDEDYIHAYKQFFSSDSWSAELNELVDLSDSDLYAVSPMGMKQLEELIEEIQAKHDHTLKMAIYAPSDLQYNLAQQYKTFFVNLPHEIRVFRDFDAAVGFVSL